MILLIMLAGTDHNKMVKYSNSQINACAQAFVARGWVDGVPDADVEHARRVASKAIHNADAWNTMSKDKRFEACKLVKRVMNPKPAKKVRKPGPVRPRTAFIFFFQDNSEKYAGNPKAAGEAWAKCKESGESAKYITMQNEDKVRYDRELLEFKSA